MNRIDLTYHGWQSLARVLMGYVMGGNALYVLLDPGSNAARAVMHMGHAIEYLMAIQILAATVVIGQAFSANLRSSSIAFVPWMILAFCALIRFAGSVHSTKDAFFQSPLYFAFIVLCAWGAWNASRTR